MPTVCSPCKRISGFSISREFLSGFSISGEFLEQRSSRDVEDADSTFPPNEFSIVLVRFRERSIFSFTRRFWDPRFVKMRLHQTFLGSTFREGETSTGAVGQSVGLVK